MRSERRCSSTASRPLRHQLTCTPEAFTAASLAERNGTPMPGVDPNGPPLVTALAQQAGLRLQPIRAPIEIIVIDRLERPSEN